MKKPIKSVSKENYSSSFFIENPSLMKQWHESLRDERNVIRTTSLFWEVRREREDPSFVPLFTLKDKDHLVDGITYLSLKQIYFSYDHIPGFEYEFAMDVFNSWDIWVKITKSSIRYEFQAWRDELEIKIKANAIRSMISASRSEDAKGVAAAKYLADKGYTEVRKAGRPSKDEVDRERKIQAEVRDTLQADMERVGLTIAK